MSVKLDHGQPSYIDRRTANSESLPVAPTSTDRAATGSGLTLPAANPRSRVALAVAAAVIVLGVVLAVWASRTARPAQPPAMQRDPSSTI